MDSPLWHVIRICTVRPVYIETKTAQASDLQWGIPCDMMGWLPIGIRSIRFYVKSYILLCTC